MRYIMLVVIVSLIGVGCSSMGNFIKIKSESGKVVNTVHKVGSWQT